MFPCLRSSAPWHLPAAWRWSSSELESPESDRRGAQNERGADMSLVGLVLTMTVVGVLL